MLGSYAGAFQGVVVDSLGRSYVADSYKGSSGYSIRRSLSWEDWGVRRGRRAVAHAKRAGFGPVQPPFIASFNNSRVEIFGVDPTCISRSPRKQPHG